MPDRPTAAITFRHAESREELAACFSVIRELRPYISRAADWCERALTMAEAGYRVLVAWEAGRAVAMAGYRINENLIYGRFLYVDDLVTASDRRGEGLGAAILGHLSGLAENDRCKNLILDTAATNSAARRFYKREGLLDLVVGFVKPLGPRL